MKATRVHVAPFELFLYRSHSSDPLEKSFEGVSFVGDMNDDGGFLCGRSLSRASRSISLTLSALPSMVLSFPRISLFASLSFLL